jgi:AcrR family transcriptional regulator
LKVRGERAAATRARIVEATVALHEELGPRRTTVSAIAERARVERLTVYRHFPDERAILAACSGCWLERNPVPDPAAWRDLASPAGRTRKALHLLFAYYSRTHRMLERILHDAADMPIVAETSQGFIQYTASVADDLLAAWNPPPASRGALRAVLRHAVNFTTWVSLQREGLGDAAKVRLIVTWASAVCAESAQAAR